MNDSALHSKADMFCHHLSTSMWYIAVQRIVHSQFIYSSVDDVFNRIASSGITPHAHHCPHPMYHRCPSGTSSARLVCSRTRAACSHRAMHAIRSFEQKNVLFFRCVACLLPVRGVMHMCVERDSCAGDYNMRHGGCLEWHVAMERKPVYLRICFF